MDRLKAWFLLIVLALFSFVLSFVPPFSTISLSPLIIAVILGAIISNVFENKVSILHTTGVSQIATKQILRLGIILFGFKISLGDIAYVGFSGVLLAFLVVFSTFFLGLFIGKCLGIDKKSAMLISCGSSICGAAAVMASEDVIKGGANRLAVAICCVVVFGTLGMLTYPFLFKIFDFGLNYAQIGVFMGASLHEVAHVVAASSSDTIMQINAVIIKMLRVIMLVPFLFILPFLCTQSTKFKTQNIPFFALWFLAAICVSSLPIFPKNLLTPISYIDTILLCIAMTALGVGIKKDVLKSVGLRPFVLASFLFVWLIVMSFVFVKIFIG